MSQLIDRVMIGVGLVSGLLAILLFAPPASAVSGSDWNAGNIMDDGIFFSPGEMSTGNIQNFLNAKVPVCDTWGTQPYAGTTRAAYGASRGYPAPYTCLKSYIENPSTHQNNANGGSVSGGWTSAQIIKYAADYYTINPKVLIVLLQKEQSLVTDDWPWTIQYRSATGYGCPDTAPCDAQYYGFYNQVMKAAYQFRRYATYPGDYRYKAYQLNYIQYNPNTGCGGTNVGIANQATAGLYNYTPYQPNASALANLYGSGDGCGAYGNRNFWRTYNDWFGNTHGPAYSWQYQGQNAYTNSTKTVSVNTETQTLVPNTRYYAVVRAKNTGSATWIKGNFRLGTTNPPNQRSVICDIATWISCGRPATLVEDSIAPGQIGTFEFWFKTPGPGINTKAYFDPLQEGVMWLNDVGMHFVIKTKSEYSWQYQGQSMYTDGTKSVTIDSTNNSLKPGARYYAVVRLKNTGNLTWYQGNFRLGVSRPTSRISAISDSSWLSVTRPATLTDASVPPEGTGTFEFWIKVPNTAINTKEYFTPLQEGVTWLTDYGLHYVVRNTGMYAWEYKGQSLYTDNSKTTPVNFYSQILAKDTRYYALVRLKNTGNVIWYQGNFRLGVSRPTSRISAISDPSWTVPQTRPATLVESAIRPGEIGTFEFWIRTPNSSVRIKEYFTPLQENIIWLNDIGLHYIINTY